MKAELQVERDAPAPARRGDPIGEPIDGVVYERLTPFVDHRGKLVEVVDIERPFWDEPVVYSYCLTIEPGRIKGWGMHKLQTDRYFVASGRVRVVLYDGRAESPTYERFNQFYFSEAASGLLRIPTGIWHAAQNWGGEPVVIMNFPTRPYDRAEPDKYRIDPHSDVIPFDWSLPDA